MQTVHVKTLKERSQLFYDSALNLADTFILTPMITSEKRHLFFSAHSYPWGSASVKIVKF